MQWSVVKQVRKYNNNKRHRKAWNKIVIGMASVVVFATTYMLILPAITMEKNAFCGTEEHLHDSECFEKQLVCGFEPEEPHVHVSECYEEHQILICDKEEILPHTHDASCVQQEIVLICTEDHEHTEECSQITETYICGMDEIGHSHGSECYETQLVLVCDSPESSESHTHSDECYEEVLICTQAEHEHGLGCYSNSYADVENPSVWESSLSNVELTGIWADDVVAIAESQIGYTESTQNYIVTEAGIVKGYSRYGAWYGDSYGDWCAMFASFCLHYAGVEDFPLDANCVNWIKQLEDPQYDSYFRRDTYYPRPGDLIFFNIDSDGGADHVGIVAEVIEKTDTEPAKVKTIEGNSANRVQYVTYEMNNPIILGYGKLPEKPNPTNTEEQFVLTAVTSDGQSLTLTGPNTSLPFPAEEIAITAEAIVNEGAAALVGEAVADTELANGQMYLFDIRLWHNGEEIEPIGPVSLSIGGVAAIGEDQNAKVFHVDEENGQATDMNAEVQEDGEIVFDTDHFSLYSVILSAEDGDIPVEASADATWNDAQTKLTTLSFTASNSSVDNVYYHVQYSDDGGTTWLTVASSEKTGKNKIAIMDASSSLTNALIDRVFRVYATDNKGTPKTGSSSPVSFYSLLDSLKEGFSIWVAQSYVQDFDGTIPTTVDELYQAFAMYQALPSLTLQTRAEGTNMHVDAVTDAVGTFTYQWEYQDTEGNWVSLCEDTDNSIDASSIPLLQESGQQVRCKMYENGTLRAVSSPQKVDPKRLAYDIAIQEINNQLNLGELEIGGHVFNDLFYYGNVAADSCVPFNNAEEYADYLAQLYIDEGIDAVRERWNYYLYDIYDPEYKVMGIQAGNYPNETVGDNGLGWPKSALSSFHSTDTLEPEIDQLNYSFLENGIDYSNFISNLEKTATARAAGDANAERKYDVDIVADGTAKANGPIAMILQIQTSWQMFNLEHANAQIGDGATTKGSASVNSELGTLYDIKHALLRFVDYMEERYPGNNLVLGITEVKHGSSQTMFLGTDASGNAMYVSNNYDILRQAILQWDTFGNCEHVHYDTVMLENAVNNLTSNLEGWEDLYNVPLTLDRIRKIGIIIGGPTENTPKQNGYGCELPWEEFGNLDSVYGIRTNVGTSYSGGYISWLENSANNGGTPFAGGTGNQFTQKYVASSEAAIYETLIRIAQQELKKNMIELTDPGVLNTYVEDVVVTDTVTREFSVDTTEPITATIYNKDGSVETTVTLPLDDPNLTLQVNDDGTTTVAYNFGTVWNGQKAVLHFTVVAKEDYIGSNNVFTNVGTPEASYVHNKEDGTFEHYEVDCVDTPQVNVPIRFSTVDGETADILVGDNVDLKDLSTEIAKNAEDLVDDYSQTNGTLSYIWVLPDGTEVSVGSVSVRNGSIGAQTFPDRSQIFEGTREGQYTGTLKVTFTPETADLENPNFSNAATAAPVNPRTEDGNVWINVYDASSETRFFVRKEWAGDPPDGTDFIIFRVLSNGQPVLNEEGTELRYTLSDENGWETEISGLPGVIDGVIQHYTVEEVDPPIGYSASYSDTTKEVDAYSAKVKLTFESKDKKVNKLLEIKYLYNGGERTFRAPAKADYAKNETYSFWVEGLPLDPSGQPYSCEFVSICAIKDDGKTEEFNINSSSAEAVRYLSSTTSVEVKVITNAPSYALPETGGPGTTLFTLSGLCLIASALMYRYYARHRRERRVRS